MVFILTSFAALTATFNVTAQTTIKVSKPVSENDAKEVRALLGKMDAGSMSLHVKTADNKSLVYGTAKGKVAAGTKASLSPDSKAAVVTTSLTSFFSKNRTNVADRAALGQVKTILAKYE